QRDRRSQERQGDVGLTVAQQQCRQGSVDGDVEAGHTGDVRLGAEVHLGIVEGDDQVEREILHEAGYGALDAVKNKPDGVLAQDLGVGVQIVEVVDLAEVDGQLTASEIEGHAIAAVGAGEERAEHTDDIDVDAAGDGQVASELVEYVVQIIVVDEFEHLAEQAIGADEVIESRLCRLVDRVEHVIECFGEERELENDLGTG